MKLVLWLSKTLISDAKFRVWNISIHTAIQQRLLFLPEMGTHKSNHNRKLTEVLYSNESFTCFNGKELLNGREWRSIHQA